MLINPLYSHSPRFPPLASVLSCACSTAFAVVVCTVSFTSPVFALMAVMLVFTFAAFPLMTPAAVPDAFAASVIAASPFSIALAISSVTYFTSPVSVVSAINPSVFFFWAMVMTLVAAVAFSVCSFAFCIVAALSSTCFWFSSSAFVVSCTACLLSDMLFSIRLPISSKLVPNGARNG